MKSLEDFSYEEILDFTQSFSLPKYRAKQIYEMITACEFLDENTTLPKSIKALLGKYPEKALSIIEEIKGDKGVIKYLYLLNDGNIIEGVFLPNNYGNTLCISTQVGCGMGCVFCASGVDGLVRNLTAGEILSQVLCVNRRIGGNRNKRAVSNLVLMGSGEPLHNYENVLKFLKMVADKEGLGISPRNITISTCGLPQEIISLANEKIPVTLTVSLHAADDITRQSIMPIAKRYPLKEIISAADVFFVKTRRRVSYEYVLSSDNTDEKSIYNLIKLLAGKPVHVNLIELNDVSEATTHKISKEKAKYIKKTLEDKGLSVTIRKSLGSDIEGACGQLRNKYIRTP